WIGSIGTAIAVDAQNRATVVGMTDSLDFPSDEAYQSSYGGGLFDAFVAQVTMTGALSYSMYYGGSGEDVATGVALDPRGHAYVSGWTGSADLPGTSGSFQPTNHAGGTGTEGGDQAFVAKIQFPPNAPKFTSIAPDTGSSPTDWITTAQNLTISGTADPNVTVTLERADVGVLGSVPAGSSGNWSYSYTATTLAEGTYDFVARATNADGLKSDYSSPEFLVTVDRTAPQVSLTAPSSTASRGPEVRVAARDLIGVPANATFTLD